MLLTLAPHLILWCPTPQVGPVPPSASQAEVSSNLELSWQKQLSSFLQTSPNQLLSPPCSGSTCVCEGTELTQGWTWEQTAFVQLKLCLTSGMALFALLQEISVVTGRFSLCSWGHNPMEDSLLQCLWSGKQTWNRKQTWEMQRKISWEWLLSSEKSHRMWGLRHKLERANRN